MKYAGTIVLVPFGEATKAIVISPDDNIWFVPAEDAPPDMKETQATIEADGRRVVLGHLTIADDYKPR